MCVCPPPIAAVLLTLPTPGPAEQVNYSSNRNECDQDDHNLANTNTHMIHHHQTRCAQKSKAGSPGLACSTVADKGHFTEGINVGAYAVRGDWQVGAMLLGRTDGENHEALGGDFA
jgi:hypothetical protein